MFGVLVCSPGSEGKNIGDYIQSVAQEQFLPKRYCYVERESLNTFHSDGKTNVIMNGWFMWNPSAFPPSDDINPLFVSFHIVPAVANAMLTKNGVEYLRKYQPIGARDLGTQKILQEHGVASYFSGCLTLTLGRSFKQDKKMGGVIFVDPYYPIAGMRLSLFNLLEYLKCFWRLLKNYSKAVKLKDIFVVENRTIFRFLSSSFERLYCAANFYDYYKHSFSDEVLFSSEYITHNIDARLYNNNDEWMEAAKELIKKYASAKLVITSRIHCGLPCLGVETPCIFVTSDVLSGNKLRSAGRFGGLLDLFHVVKWTPEGLKGITDEMKALFDSGKVDVNTAISIRREYKALSEKLTKTVTDFIQNIDTHE